MLPDSNSESGVKEHGIIDNVDSLINNLDVENIDGLERPQSSNNLDLVSLEQPYSSNNLVGLERPQSSNVLVKDGLEQPYSSNNSLGLRKNFKNNKSNITS